MKTLLILLISTLILSILLICGVFLQTYISSIGHWSENAISFMNMVITAYAIISAALLLTYAVCENNKIR
jgi:hypothetical protein